VWLKALDHLPKKHKALSSNPSAKNIYIYKIIQLADELNSFRKKKIQMFNILSYKGNANQNIIEIHSHHSHKDYHQENKQQMLAWI
jgi:hypothetical protein